MEKLIFIWLRHTVLHSILSLRTFLQEQSSTLKSVKKYSSLIPISCLLAAFLLIGCSHLSFPTHKNNEKELCFALHGDPFSLDPRIGGTNSDQILTRALFEGLLRMGKEGLPELALASSYTISEDATTYTFTLKPSKWSNGQDVTASDFVYAWKSVINRSVPSPYGYVFFIIKNARPAYQDKKFMNSIGLEALDASTLRITLEHPAPYFLELLCNPLYSPVCQSLVEKDPFWTQGHFVSNGPFMLETYKTKSSLILKKNPLYWDHTAVKTETLSFAIVEDAISSYNMFCTGALDWYGSPFVSMPLEFLDELKKKDLLQIKTTYSLIWLVCNTQKKELSIPEFRLAIASALDRSAICKNLFQDSACPTYSFVHPSLSLLSAPTFQESIPLSQKYLHIAAKKLNCKKDGFPSLSLLTSTSCSFITLSQAIQYQLQQNLNIDIQIEPCDVSTFWPRIFSGKFDLVLFSWVSWFGDPLYTMNFLRETNNGINNTRWRSAEYTQLLDASDSEIDKDKRILLLKKAEALAMREMPIIPIGTKYNCYAKTNICGEIFPSTGVLDLKRIEREPPQTK